MPLRSSVLFRSHFLTLLNMARVAAVIALTGSVGVLAIDNGKGLTPPLGW